MPRVFAELGIGDLSRGDSITGVLVAVRYDEIKARSLQLLDYLAAVAVELQARPKRRVAEHSSPVIRPADVPAH